MHHGMHCSAELCVAPVTWRLCPIQCFVPSRCIMMRAVVRVMVVLMKEEPWQVALTGCGQGPGQLAMLPVLLLVMRARV